MAWIAAAIVFCFLMWKWPRKTLKGLGFCAIIGIALSAIFAGVVKYRDYKRDALKKAIKISIEYSPTICSDSKYPLALEIVNSSDTKVYKIEFSISAYAHERSTNLVEYYSRYECDKILESGQDTAACFPVPKLKEGYAPEQLDWRVYVTGVETRGDNPY